MQPRYAAYCITFCATSREEMVERDAAIWPGGKMTGFMLWLGHRWRKWELEKGMRLGASKTVADHDAFTDWLLERAQRSWI